MNYINYRQTEELLRLYIDICKKIKELQETLNKLCENDMDERIYSLVIGNRELTGMPFPPAGNTSDKTAKVALSFRENIERSNRKAVSQIQWELEVLENVINKIDLVYEDLPPIWKKIIIGKYYSCPVKTWREVTKSCNRRIDKRTLQNYKKQTLSRFYKDIKVVNATYDDVLRIMGRDKGGL